MAAGLVDFQSIVGTGTDAFKSIFNTVNPPMPTPPPRSDIAVGLTPGGLGISSGNIGAPTILLGLLAIIIVVGITLVRPRRG